MSHPTFHTVGGTNRTRPSCLNPAPFTGSSLGLAPQVWWVPRGLHDGKIIRIMNDMIYLLHIMGAYPSETYEFVNWDDDIPNIRENKTCSKPPTRSWNLHEIFMTYSWKLIIKKDINHEIWRYIYMRKSEHSTNLKRKAIKGDNSAY